MERPLKRLAILGSTGSVGRQTLDVVRQFPGEFEVVALCAGRNARLLEEQVAEFKPRYFSCAGSAAMVMGGSRYAPPEDIVTLPEVDLVVAAMVGSPGMAPLHAALRAGKQVALANKEPMVMAGELLMAAATDNGAALLPVDSEPSAIWQCLLGEKSPPRRLVLTASGGSFRDRAWPSLRDVTPAEALRHPTWSMGQKITIDSATLMNKAFEVMESRWLFGVPYASIDVVIHRQSIIHSMVEFEDGSVKAQLAPPDMRYPIQYALFHPRRRSAPSMSWFDTARASSLTFEAMDSARYPCFELAMEYAHRGGTWPAALTGADEAAVTLFLEGRIRFTDLPDVIAATLAGHSPASAPSLQDTIDAASWASEHTLNNHRVTSA
jgi:1-deoxy-D-xylulose-5-phosphate reductoisomerase